MDEEAILKRTFSLYSKYGIKSVGVDDVAFMLGMSKKTIYERFKNRETLIGRAVRNNIDSFVKGLDDVMRPDGDVFTRLCRFYAYLIKSTRKINPAFIHDLKKYSRQQYKLFIQLRDEKLYEIVSQIIKKGISEGIFRDDVPDKYLYNNQMDKVLMMVHESRFQDDTPLLPSLVAYMLILNDIRGITTQKGHEELEKRYETLLKLI
ncbi:MAG: TetR/AcrR family transcriptional regulator [Prolixibacteraceae bacterium]|jgi:AcrR family transcriptional regulator|nr:TetR/AcrR family transcriptional regulator [Prolixibacteraceae bacterium]